MFWCDEEFDDGNFTFHGNSSAGCERYGECDGCEDCTVPNVSPLRLPPAAAAVASAAVASAAGGSLKRMRAPPNSPEPTPAPTSPPHLKRSRKQ